VESHTVYGIGRRSKASPIQKALDVSSACLVMMLLIPCSLRWHYPDQVPTVGDKVVALSAWLSQAPVAAIPLLHVL
jgi:hypothetical protein